jgi:hypothetical protein
MVDVGAGCVPIDPQDPAQRTKAEVCARWVDGHTLTDPHPFSRATTDTCDPGTLSAAGHDDVLTRLNLFRWLTGFAPTTLDTSMDAEMQKCANERAMACDWPSIPYYGGPRFGGNAPDAIESWIENTWNKLTFFDRTMLLRGNLTDVRIGYWEGGTNGAAHCLDYSNTNSEPFFPASGWFAVPNPGPVPLEVAKWEHWTFNSNAIPGTTSPRPKISVKRISDGANLPVFQSVLAPGSNLTAWTREGWMPVAGESYRVTVSGLPYGDITYVVTPVACD